jgi:hypothetical protein
MEKRSNIANLLKTLTLVCGLLAITISSFSNLIQERIEDDLSKIELNEENENPEPNHEIIYLPDYLASISSFQIHLDWIQDLLFNIPFITEIKSWCEYVLEYQSISFFKVLFHNIIAPNAP